MSSADSTQFDRDSIRFGCPVCGESISVGLTLGGKRTDCPHCKQPIRVPGAFRSKEISALEQLAICESSARSERALGRHNAVMLAYASAAGTAGRRKLRIACAVAAVVVAIGVTLLHPLDRASKYLAAARASSDTERRYADYCARASVVIGRFQVFDTMVRTENIGARELELQHAALAGAYGAFVGTLSADELQLPSRVALKGAMDKAETMYAHMTIASTEVVDDLLASHPDGSIDKNALEIMTRYVWYHDAQSKQAKDRLAARKNVEWASFYRKAAETDLIGMIGIVEMAKQSIEVKDTLSLQQLLSRFKFNDLSARLIGSQTTPVVPRTAGS